MNSCPTITVILFVLLFGNCKNKMQLSEFKDKFDIYYSKCSGNNYSIINGQMVKSKTVVLYINKGGSGFLLYDPMEVSRINEIINNHLDIINNKDLNSSEIITSKISPDSSLSVKFGKGKSLVGGDVSENEFLGKLSGKGKIFKANLLFNDITNGGSYPVSCDGVIFDNPSQKDSIKFCHYNFIRLN